MEPIVKSLDEFLGERGLAAPMSDFMVDKIKVPHGLTQRKRKALEKEAAEASQQYSRERKTAIEEYNRLLSEGKVRAPSNIDRLLKVAAGHEDNLATQAARRALGKRGIDWRSEVQYRKEFNMESIIKNDFFELTETGRDYDFIATIKNLTDHPLKISFDFINMDRYDDCLEDIEIAPRDWVGLLSDDDGRETLAALKNGDFSLGTEEISEQRPPLYNNNTDKLPARCYAVHNETGSVIIVKNGETGYYNTCIGTKDAAESREIVDEYNAKLGVSKAQAAAMYAGSMFGFHVPAANPEMYDENGAPKRQSLDSRIKSAEEQKTDLSNNSNNRQKDKIDLMK